MSETQYVSPNAVYDGGLTYVPGILPAYVYQEYADDDNIRAFFTSYNNLATQYLLWFSSLNLPIYTGGIIAGALLDWVALGLYGIIRPSITTGSVFYEGATNTVPTNVVATNSQLQSSTEALQSTSDDIFRRVITWNFYKGDGFVFNMQWLKRRVFRFLNGPNGVSPVIDQTYTVSCTVTGNTFAVVVATGDAGTIALLNNLIGSGACAIPFQYVVTVAT
jgi:hypothetical protein